MGTVSPRQLIEMIAGVLGVHPDCLSENTRAGDIPEWDSLAQVAIITTLEDEFDRVFDTDELMEAASVKRLLQLLNQTPQADTGNNQAISEAPVKNEILPGDEPIVIQILHQAATQPAKTALVFQNESQTYHQLAQGIRQAASWLSAQGLTKGATIALAAGNHREFFYLYFGAHLAGIQVLNLDAQINQARYEAICHQISPALTIGITACTASQPYPISFEEAEAFPPICAPHCIADIMFTTGTTNEPKGVPLTHANLSAAARQINEYIANGKDDVEVLALPVCHSFGMGRVRCVLACGGTLVFSPGFSNTKSLLSLLRDYRATGFAFVPSAWAYLSKMTGDKIAQYAPTLRYIEIGSAPMPVDERKRLMKLFPHTRICMHYGLTEASRSAFIEFHTEAHHLNSAGKASPGTQLAIFSEEGSHQPAGEEGEICVAGAHVVNCYLRGNVADCRYGDFFRTGDWGMIDADGYLHVLSRTKDIINVGGKKVSPDEVEQVLRKMPCIADCACVPATDPDGILGEVVKAYLVLSENAEKPTQAYIRHHASQYLEQYKVPVLMEWRDSLPKTTSGKLQRRLLK